MGCLYHLGKFAVLYFSVGILCLLLVSSFVIDFMLTVKGEKPYFFDPNYIEAYDSPMFDGMTKDMQDHFENYKEEILALKKELVTLPNNKKLEVEYLEGSEIDLTADYKGGYLTTNQFNYKSRDREEVMEKLGVTPQVLDNIKDKLEDAHCFSFEKDDGIRIGFKTARSGTYYYRYKTLRQRNPEALLDSCLVMKLNDEILIEYKGKGRGPDCIKSQNPEGYDDRGFIKKWIDLILNGMKINKK